MGRPATKVREAWGSAPGVSPCIVLTMPKARAPTMVHTAPILSETASRAACTAVRPASSSCVMGSPPFQMAGGVLGQADLEEVERAVGGGAASATLFGGLVSRPQRADQPDRGDERFGRAWRGIGFLGQHLRQDRFVTGGHLP